MREVALILNMNKPYDRKVIDGIAAWIRENDGWNLYIEDDSLAKIPDLGNWRGQGVVADFDDPRVSSALSGLSIPIVGLGGGYRGSELDVPTVYYDTDNEGIAKLAAEHFLERGFRRFAYCGYPRTGYNNWARERGEWLARFAEEADCSCQIYHGRHATPRQWASLQKSLRRWLRSLKPPVAILAANDARARHLLVACRDLGLRVPEDVAILGVDNDETICELSRPPLSSVIQGAERLGFEAAALLARLMDGHQPEANHYVIPPVGIATRQSTEILAIEDPVMAAALSHIRQFACNSLQVDDVAKAANASRSSLEKKFRTLLKRSVCAEIKRVQLARVEELLLRSDLPLKEVASRTGYGSVQYMSTVFRNEYNVTPGKFRSQRG